MEIRKQKAKKEQFEKYSKVIYMESTGISHPIDKEHDDKIEEKLNRCIEELKKEQKSCVRLFYYEKKCYREISNQLGIDQKKVKSYIQNGKRNLKICLEQYMKRNEV